MLNSVSLRSIDGTNLGAYTQTSSTELHRAEALIAGAALTLVGLGLVMIYNTSGVLAGRFGSPTFFLAKQTVWAVAACAALVVTRSVDYHLYARLRKPILVAVVALLALVLIPGIGVKLNGARRWFRFAGAGFQPSDVAKLGLVVYLAGFLGEKQNTLGDWRRGFLPPVGVLTLTVGLIALEPDIGTAALVACTGGALLVIGGVRLRHVVPAALMAAPIAAALVLVRFNHVRERLFSFIDPSADPLGTGYHARQSLIALASGGGLGRGLAQGSQKLFFLPEAHTDFIFAIVGEELGYAGAIFVIGAFVALLYGAMSVVRWAPDPTGSLIAAGIALWLGLQAAFNIAVVTASVPTKGIPLPFVSYGGSTLVVTAAALGVLLNIAGHGLTPPRRGLVGGTGSTP
jgi:cell division protein FtsW